MAVGGSPEGDENGGAARGGDFRSRDGSSAANDDVGPGKTLGHIGHEREDFSEDFAARVSSAHRVVIPLAGLMHDAQLIFSRGQVIHGIDECAIDRQSALAATGYEQPQWIRRLARRDGKEFGAHRATGNDGLSPPRLRRNFITGGDTLRETREKLVGETRFGVRLKNNVGHASKPRRKHHRSCGVSADAKGRNWVVLAQHPARVKHGGEQHRQILEQGAPAFAFEPGDAQSFERQARLRHQLHLNSALGSHQHDFPFFSPGKPLAGNGQRRENVPACAAACDQEFHVTRPPLKLPRPGPAAKY